MIGFSELTLDSVLGFCVPNVDEIPKDVAGAFEIRVDVLPKRPDPSCGDSLVFDDVELLPALLASEVGKKSNFGFPPSPNELGLFVSEGPVLKENNGALDVAVGAGKGVGTPKEPLEGEETPLDPGFPKSVGVDLEGVVPGFTVVALPSIGWLGLRNLDCGSSSSESPVINRVSS